MARHVVIVSEDPMGEMLGGAAIRAYEIARALTDVAEVTLAAPGTAPSGLAPARHFAFTLDDPRPLRALFNAADVVIMRPPNPVMAGWLRKSGARIVFDLNDPLPLDVLEARKDAPRSEQLLWNGVALDQFLDALHTGHHFICGGRRQRDLYVGALLASRLIAPAAYKADPSFRRFLDCVPFGILADEPRRIEGAGPRTRFPQLGEEAQIVLWNGGIWNWLDPVTAVAATARAAEQNPRVRLLFMFAGARNGRLEGEAGKAHDLARRLGVIDSLVFFNDAPVSYAERATWLLDAHCLISTNPDDLEASFALRTRLLDCFWVGVPAVCTAGDEISERIESCNGGVTVPPGDVDAVAAGIAEVLERGPESYRSRLTNSGGDLVWPRAVGPLKRIVALEGKPRALGDPLARRVSSPMRRSRAAAIRLMRTVRG
jgi:glycosyltransferase involved in cell wall biosynthesis